MGLHGFPFSPLPYPIPVYDVDGTLNRNSSIKRLCPLDMKISNHTERINFRVTETGSSNIILGLDWLHLYDPLINWSEGNLSFIHCPSTCTLEPVSLWDSSIKSHHPPPLNNLQKPPEDLGLDGNSTRTIFDCSSQEEIINEWYKMICEELGPEDESLLCVNLNAGPTHTTSDTDRITNYLRKTQETSTGIDKYLKEFSPVFSQSGFDDLPPRRSWDHTIELKTSADTSPISSKVYSLSCPKQVELNKLLDEHLKSGRIRPSKSPITSPFFFVKKKDGSLRPVQDYHRLNKMTIRNRYPLPLMSELMDKLKGAKYFTKLDVCWGYKNIHIKEGDEWKATFITNRGLFEPTVMFFGLTNSPATFQNMMNDIFHDLLLMGFVIIYMDDILIFTKDLPTHKIITRQVLETLQKNQLFLKPEKCSFEALEVDYLGVIVSHGEIKMDKKKVESLQSWPISHCKKDVQQFLGFINFYRCFIKDFAKLAQPLNRLCGSTPWSWSETELASFSSLHDAVISGPPLAIPLDEAPFQVEADSLGYDMGAIFSQLQEDKWHPIAFFSKSLSNVERNYNIHDHELLSIMQSLA